MAFYQKAGTIATGGTSTGVFCVTGLGFKPKIVLFSIQNSSSDGVNNNVQWATGAMDQDGNQWSVYVADNRNVGTTNNYKGISTSSAGKLVSQDNGSTTFEFSFT